MIDQYYANTQVIITALYIVIPSVLIGVVASKIKNTKPDKRFIIAGICGIAVSSLVYFAAAFSLIPENGCCETDLDESNAMFFSLLRFLSTPFALVSVCLFYRGLHSNFDKRYIAETSVLLILIWLLLFFL